MNPLQKRNNPFAKQINQNQPKKEFLEPQNDEIEQIEEFFEEPEPVVEVKRPQPQPKVVHRQAPKPVYEPTLDNNRVKYTSTMDKNLRREIKIICAQRGLLFAAFIEDACREKLRREGVL